MFKYILRGRKMPTRRIKSLRAYYNADMQIKMPTYTK